MQKIIGCVLIIAAGSGLGVLKGMELQRYLKEMQYVRQIFWMLRSEIKYTKSPFAEAFGNIGRRLSGSYRKWLMELSRRLEEKSGVTFQHLWREAIDEFLKDTSLKKTDIEKLKAMGLNMGYLDEEMQLGTIDLYLEQLDGEIKRTRESLATKQRLCNCLGVMGGIFLAVVLI